MSDYKWDVFISHASEDKEAFVRPFANALQNLFEVWFDDHVLTVGDSLRQKIDEGLSSARFGIVVISKNFFAKCWPQKELDALEAIERDGIKSILPVWHGVGREVVSSHSPLLAGRLAVSTEQGTDHVVRQGKWPPKSRPFFDGNKVRVRRAVRN